VEYITDRSFKYLYGTEKISLGLSFGNTYALYQYCTYIGIVEES